jgi:parallel beta-helix repeat protein
MTPKTIIFCTLLVLFSFSQIQATIIHVPADYSTIQAGINGAVGGDTVLVARGHYYERIDFRGKGILVTSNLIFDNDSNTIDSTIIDANGTGSVVWFDSGEDSTSVIQGFTITGGDGTWGEGGGIWCRWCSPTIRNNTIAANSAGRGGGIWCHDSSPNIHNNTLMGNFADFQGGGIYYQGDSPPRIENNAIIGNSAGSRGGGIAVYTYMSTISGNTISGNSAGNLGGGIYVAAYSSSPHIWNNARSGNSASSCGGAIFCDQSSQPNIQNNSITGNEADSAGGGICCRVSFPTIRNNMIVNNGQGIVCGPESAPVVYHNDVWGNVDGDFCACAPGVGDTSWGVNVNGTPCDSFYNIMRDPVFVDPDSDSHLQDGSPCIDAGDNHAPGLRETDFDGNPRIIDGNEDGTAVVDLGMLEYLPRDLIAYFSASDTSGLVPLAVTFIDRSIGYPTSWFWNFGDGDTSTMQNPTHSYIDTGHYDVKLVVSDGTNTDSLVRYNYIHVLPEVVADFAAEPVLGPIRPAPTSIRRTLTLTRGIST